MAKLAIWIDASLRVMKDNIEIIEECYRKRDLDLMLQQSRVFREHLDSFCDFLEKRKSEGL